MYEKILLTIVGFKMLKILRKVEKFIEKANKILPSESDDIIVKEDNESNKKDGIIYQ
jgi:hypothetical protein